MDTFKDIRKDLEVVCSKKPGMEKLNEIFLEPSANEGYFKSTITSSTGTIFVDLKEDGNNIWSKEVYELLEIEPDTYDPTPEAFLTFVVEEDRETVRQRVNDALEGRKKEDYLSYRIQTASGKIKKILAFPQIIKDGKGEALFLNVTIHDLSNMLGKPDQLEVGFEASARRLQESTHWLSKIFENSAVGIFIFNREGVIIHSNQTFSRITGYSQQELKTEIKAFDVLSEDTRKWVVEQVGLLILGKQDQINYEFPINIKSGEQKLVEGYSTLLDAEAGYILCFVTDIDEKKETQKALKVSESRLREAQKMAKMGSWGVDLDTGEVDWSSGMYEIMEIDENRPVDKDLILSLIHPEDRELFIENLMVNRKDVNGLEIRHITKSGTKHMVINAATVENRYHGTVIDISESVFFDQHLQFAQEVAKLGWWESNLVTGEDIWSDSLYDILGLDREKTTPNFEAYTSTVHPDDLAAVQASQHDPDVLKHGFHNKEVRHKMKDGSIKYVLASGQFVWDADKPVKLIGTVMDITETKTVQLRLEENQRIAKLGWYESDLTTGIDTWSDSMYELFDLDKETTKPSFKEYEKLVHAEDKPIVQAGISDPEIIKNGWQNIELRHVLKNGTQKYILSSGQFICDEKGRPVKLTGTLMDITESKSAQLRLEESQKIAKLGSFESDLVNGIDTWSDSIFEIFELDKETTKPSFEEYEKLVHKDDKHIVLANMSDPEKIKNGWHNVEIRHILKDGTQKYILSSGKFIHDKKGRPIRLTGTLMDITKAKETQLRLEEAQKIANIGWWKINLQTEEVSWSYVNQESGNAETQGPYPLEPYLQQIHPEDRDRLMSVTEDWQNLEVRFKNEKGDYNYILVNGQVIYDGKERAMLIGTNMDVTDLKQTQLRLEETQKISKLGYWEVDLKTGETEWSDTIYDIMGIDRKEKALCFEEYVKCVHPEDVAFLYRDPRDLKDGWENVELRYKRSSGGYTYVLNSGRVIFDGDEPVKMIGTNMDITDLKETQHKLEQTQKIGKLGWWETDIHTGTTEFSDSIYEMMDIEKPEGGLTLEEYAQILHPDDARDLMQDIEKGTMNDGWVNRETRYKQKDGTYRYILTSGQTIYNEEGQPVNMLGTNLDITSTKEAQLKLEEAQKIAKMGWWEADLITGVSKYSDSIYEMLEVEKPEKDYTFEKYLEHMHPDDARKLQEDFNSGKLNEGWVNRELRYKRKDGGYKYILTSGQLLFDGDKPIKLMGTNLDITSTKEAQLKLEEAQQIAKMGWWEIDLKTGISNYSDSVCEMLELDKSKRDKITFEQYLERLHPNDARQLKESIESGKLNEGWSNRELRYKRKDGGYRYILSSGRALLDGDQVIKLMGTNLDITSSKEVQLRLEQSQEIAKMGWWEFDLIKNKAQFQGPVYDLVDLGHSGSDFTIKQYLDFLHPEDSKQLIDDFKEGKLNEGWTNREVRYKRKGGGYQYSLSSGQVIFDGKKPVKLMGTKLDISSTKETQQRLEQAQKIAKMGWWEFDLTGAANHKFSADYMEIMEISDPKEIVTLEDFLDLVHPDDHQKILREHQTLEVTKGWNNLVNRVRKKSGGYKYITSNAHAEFFEGKPVRLVGSLLDITDLKEIEIELEKSEINLKALITSAENIVFVIDDQLKFREVFCNDLSKMKHSPGHFMDKHIREVWNDQLPHGKELASKCIDSMKSDAHNHMVYEFAPKEKPYWWEANIKPFKSQDGKRRLAVFVNDITTKKNAEEELIRNIQKEKELNEMSTQFVSMASHQFRTPLTVIKSNMQLLELSNIDHPIISKVSTRLNSEVDRLVNLMEDILAMGKVQSGAIKPHLREVDMIDLVKKLKLNIERSQEDGRILEVNVKGKTKMISLDTQFMEHALNNLIDNAFKYSKGAKNPEIELKYGKDKLNIRITDFGLGIPKTDQGRLFSSFQRGSNVQHISGTGLGLAVSKEFISLNGGTIFLEQNRSLNNTTFCIDLPLN